MENIIDADYAHAKRVYKGFGKRNLEDYYDLYVQSVTLLLADVFGNFRNMCLEIYEFDPAHFFHTRSSMASSLNKYQSNFKSVN